MRALTRRRLAGVSALLLLFSLVPVFALPAVATHTGTSFVIDGDKTGPNDWLGPDSQPNGAYNVIAKPDPCGNGVKEDIVVASTKLDDPWTIDPDGLANQKGDLCGVWTGFEVVEGEIVFLFAWERFGNTGTVNIYVPLADTVQPGRTGDQIFKFAYDSDKKLIEVKVLSWDGASWSGEGDITGFADAAISADTKFAEVAVNLTDAGILPEAGECKAIVTGDVVTETGQDGPNPEPTLKDYIDLPSLTLNNCGTLIVEKMTIGGVGTFSFSSGTLSPASFDLATTVESVAVSTSFVDLEPGVYDVSEDEPLPPNWDLTSATCSNGSDPAAIDLDSNETVVCTFVNTYTPPPGSIVIVKQTVGGFSTFDFTGDLGGFSLTTTAAGEAGEDSATFDDLTAGIYGVSESAHPLANWSLTSSSCDDGSSPGAIDLDPDETVTCTFVNSFTPDGSATLTVVKQVNAGAPAQSFGFTVTGQDPFNLDGGESSEAFEYVIPVGSDGVAVTATETGIGSLDPNWAFSSVSCSDGDVAVGDIVDASATVTLNDGDAVTCTFVNTFTPDGSATLTVVKQVNAGAPAQSFGFTATGEPGFELNGGESKTLTYTIPIDSEGESVTVTENTSLPANWAFSSVSCTDGESTVGTIVDASATVTLNDGDAVTCTFVNTYTPPPTIPTTIPTPTYTVGDLVWNDLNANGIQDLPFESGIPGVKIELINSNGVVIGTTFTDANGKYLFTDVLAGTYTIRFELPNFDPVLEEQFTLVGIGDEFKDSDAGLGGVTDPFKVPSELPSLVNVDYIDAGVFVVAIAGTTIAATTVPATLPFTGPSGTGSALALGMAIAGLGGLILAAVSREEEEERRLRQYQ